MEAGCGCALGEQRQLTPWPPGVTMQYVLDSTFVIDYLRGFALTPVRVETY
jgi:hypothetical protein